MGLSQGMHHYRKRVSLRYAREALPTVNETSAGGLVLKVEQGQAYAALIARRNRRGQIEWCLPKGHLEPGETAMQAARREIFEETGILGRVLKELASIDYWFAGSGRRIHKVVHHFLLEMESGQIGVENDPDHEAEQAAWVPLAEVSSYLVYANERKVVDCAFQVLGLTPPAPPPPSAQQLGVLEDIRALRQQRVPVRPVAPLPSEVRRSMERCAPPRLAPAGEVDSASEVHVLRCQLRGEFELGAAPREEAR